MGKGLAMRKIISGTFGFLVGLPGRIKNVLVHLTQFSEEMKVNEEPEILDWARVYDLLGMLVEYSQFSFEWGVNRVNGCWVIPMIKGRHETGNIEQKPGLTCTSIVNALRLAGGKVCVYCNDADKVMHVRNPNQQSYAIAVDTDFHASKALKLFSARQLKLNGERGMTGLERLMLEAAYFVTTGEYLAAKSPTLCIDSQNPEGDGVLDVGWDNINQEVYVTWRQIDSPGNSYSLAVELLEPTF